MIIKPLSKGGLKKHQRIHSGEKPYAIIEQLHQGNCHSTAEVMKNITVGKLFVLMLMVGLTNTPKGVLSFKMSFQLDYHIQSMHTEEGLTKKMKSETKLAEFLKNKDCLYTRDCENFVSFQCKPELKLEGSWCYPDFFLPDFSQKLGTNVIIGNDEFAHR